MSSWAVELLELLHPLPQIRRDAVPAAEEAGADALPREVGQLPVDRLAEDLHQRGHLVGRPRPVLGRERVDGERGDAEVDRGLDRPPQRPRSLAVARLDRQAVAGRPAAVAVHDDRDGAGAARRPSASWTRRSSLPCSR